MSRNLAVVAMGWRVSRPSHMIAVSKMRLLDGSGRLKRNSCPFAAGDPGGIAQPFGLVAAASEKSAVAGIGSSTRMSP